MVKHSRLQIFLFQKALSLHLSKCLRGKWFLFTAMVEFSLCLTGATTSIPAPCVRIVPIPSLKRRQIANLQTDILCPLLDGLRGGERVKIIRSNYRIISVLNQSEKIRFSSRIIEGFKSVFQRCQTLKWNIVSLRPPCVLKAATKIATYLPKSRISRRYRIPQSSIKYDSRRLPLRVSVKFLYKALFQRSRNAILISLFFYFIFPFYRPLSHCLACCMKQTHWF